MKSLSIPDSAQAVRGRPALSRLAALSVLALALSAPMPARSQADPACYVVNRILRWMDPHAALIACAAPRTPPPAPAPEQRTPAAPHRSGQPHQG